MTSANALHYEIMRLKEEVAEIDRKILELKKHKAIWNAKIKLMEDHVQRSRKGESRERSRTSSEDSLRTSELLDLSLSSTLDSSLYGYSSEWEDDSVEDEHDDTQKSSKSSNELRLKMPDYDDE